MGFTKFLPRAGDHPTSLHVDQEYDGLLTFPVVGLRLSFIIHPLSSPTLVDSFSF